jgi:peptidoglycan/xylan/chitin deacetylase (PgdA/CDA1 family)
MKLPSLANRESAYYFQNIPKNQSDNKPQNNKEIIESIFGTKKVTKWGEKISGIITKLNTNEKVVALTFDACGKNGYDEELINYLKENSIKATLFLSGIWIDSHREISKELSKNPLFMIENHGLNHKPCSVNGKSAYGIAGTKNVGEVFVEIEKNAQKIEKTIGQKPKFYRSGTAYYDDVCVAIAKKLGYNVAGFSIIGDGGATFSIGQIKALSLRTIPGSIFIFHMNRPTGKTFEGIRELLPILRDQGYSFVHLTNP